MSKTQIFLLISFVVFGLFAFGNVKAGIDDNVSGYAWSENIGWISFNNTTGGGATNYGVDIEPDGVFSGYAWSENIGWISFNEGELSGCPTAPCQAKLDFGTKEISGWAKAVAGSNGWDGWIKLRCEGAECATSNYGVWLDNSVSPNELRDWAWGSDVVGWISFNCLDGGNCGTSDYQVVAFSGDDTPPTVLVEGAPADWQNTDAQASISCLDTESGCNTESYKLKTYTSEPGSCPTTYSDYTLSSPQTISSYKWVCGAAKDNTGNVGFSQAPVEFKVDKTEPNSQIQSPASNKWFSDDFNLDTLDEDLDSGLDTNECQYKIIPFEDTDGDGIADTERPSSGWLSRTCNAPPESPVTTITVGETDYCKYQANKACWVYVRSEDNAGNVHTPTQPKGSIKLYHIDWTKPEPGKLYITGTKEEQTYPIKVQLDREYTFKSHVTDNLKVTACDLYIDNINQGAMSPTVPGCDTDCTFTKNFTFTGAGTYHNNFVKCKDAANNVESGTSVDIEVQTLGVTLTANPSSGTILTNFDLIATVSGTMPGTINYKFDCTSDGTWELEVNHTEINPYVATDLCNYSSPGTYTAKVFIERGTGSAGDTVVIMVSENHAPSAINLSLTEDDYCGPWSAFFSWEFSDSDPGDSQSAYRVQIIEEGGSWDFPLDEKYCVLPGCAGDSQSYAPPIGTFGYATTYYWRIRVWDNHGDFSTWTNGPSSFRTPSHVYPEPDFNWAPTHPSLDELIQFTDRTPGATSWTWDFGDGTPFSSLPNPTHSYSNAGVYTVRLEACDDVGCCPTEDDVTISLPLPEWQEISPF